ncbi:MAG: YqeG family HAD IIIA-type phosphatase [Erysipelotrichales bacterium]
MIERFKPDKYYAKVYDIDFNKIKSEGIKLVAFDLDNTLVPHDILDAPSEVASLFNKVKELGFSVIVLSNNKEERVQRFTQDLEVEYYFNARKPLAKTFKLILSDHNVKPSELCLIGDQIMTDIWGANRIGIMSVLVDQIAKRDIFYTKINRIFERNVIKKLGKKNLFKLGEYYD